jgi:hypothetical protein
MAKEKDTMACPNADRIDLSSIRHAALFILVLMACAPAETTSSTATHWQGGVETTEAGIILVNNAGGGGWVEDTVMAVRELTIGLEDGDPDYLFGDIMGVTADASGVIYIADRMGALVRAYGGDGRYLALVGGKGEGPGEFDVPIAPAVGPDGALYVRDVTSRVTRFTSRASSALLDSVATTWRGPVYPQSYKPTRFDADGQLYYPHEHGTMEVRRYFYLIYDGNGEFVDTLMLPDIATMPASTAWFRTSERGGRMVDGLNRVPFSPMPSWDVTGDGHLLFGEGDEYSLFMTNTNGDTLRRISRNLALSPIPDGERRDSATALQTRKDTLPVPISEVFSVPDEVREGILPETLPAFLSVNVATDGKLWIERWPLAGRRDETFFDVFGPEGIYLGVVVIPASILSEPAPHITGSRVYGITRDEMTGVERVAVFTFRTPNVEEGLP